MRKRVFLNLFQKPAAQPVMHIKSSADNLTCQFLVKELTVPVLYHLRLSVSICRLTRDPF